MRGYRLSMATLDIIELWSRDRKYISLNSYTDEIDHCLHSLCFLGQWSKEYNVFT